MFDTLQVGNSHQVTIGVSDYDDISMNIQAPTIVQVVISSQSVSGFACKHGIMIPKRMLRVEGEIRQPGAI